MTEHNQYRPEIDGLRALAVLPVVIFHAGFYLPGGFLGVDIFYVISGYLITGIIYKQYLTSSFSFKNFYEHRVRRIIPLLIVVIGITSIISWMALSSNEINEYGRSVISTILFVSNIFFWKTTGYFTQGAENKPLLHTWSLSVEEQYYILFPLIFIILINILQKKSIYVLIIGVVIGLFFSQYMSTKSADFSFYMFTSRAWELLAGAATAVAVEDHGRKPIYGLSSLGLVLIFGAYIFCYNTMVHPGFLTVPTILGVTLILAFADPDRQGGWLLSRSPMVFIGKISYGIYLWHQPVLAFLRLWSEAAPSVVSRTGAILFTIGLSYLTWRFVEEPFRKRGVIESQWAYPIIGVGSFLLVIIGFAYANLPKSHFPLRPNDIFLTDDRAYCPAPVKLGAENAMACILGDRTRPAEIAVIGDSTANALSGALDEHAKDSGLSILSLAVEGCTALPGFDYSRFTGESCGRLQSSALLAILKDPSIKRVVIVNRWTLFLSQTGFDNEEGGIETVILRPRSYQGRAEQRDNRRANMLESTRRLLELLIQNGKIPYLMYPIPESGWVSSQYLQARHLHGNYDDVTTSFSTVTRRNQMAVRILDEAAEGLPIHKVYPQNALCTTTLGRCHVTKAQVPLYVDSGHLSRAGAALVVAPLIIDLTSKNADERLGQLRKHRH